MQASLSPQGQGAAQVKGKFTMATVPRPSLALRRRVTDRLRSLALAQIRVIVTRLFWNFDLVLQTPRQGERAWDNQREYALFEGTPLRVMIIDRSDER